MMAEQVYEIPSVKFLVERIRKVHPDADEDTLTKKIQAEIDEVKKSDRGVEFFYYKDGDNKALFDYMWQRLPKDPENRGHRITASGKSVTKKEASIDHIFPQSKSKSMKIHFISNLQIVPRSGNSSWQAGGEKESRFQETPPTSTESSTDPPSTTPAAAGSSSRSSRGKREGSKKAPGQ